MKVRLLAVAGGVAALGALGAIPALAAGAGSGPCTTPGPSNSSTPVITTTPGAPSPGPGPATIYGGGSPTSGGYAGVSGSDGYLEAGGSTSGGSISGETTQGPGLNGVLSVSQSPTICIGNNTTNVSG